MELHHCEHLQIYKLTHQPIPPVRFIDMAFSKNGQNYERWEIVANIVYAIFDMRV